LELKTDRC